MGYITIIISRVTHCWFLRNRTLKTRNNLWDPKEKPLLIFRLESSSLSQRMLSWILPYKFHSLSQFSPSVTIGSSQTLSHLVHESLQMFMEGLFLYQIPSPCGHFHFSLCFGVLHGCLPIDILWMSGTQSNPQ